VSDFFSELDARPVLVFFAGLLIGRFLNLCIVRFPQNDYFTGQLKLLWEGPRDCPGCGRTRRWWQMLPVISWRPAWGRCVNCGRRLPRRFAFVEILTGGLLAALYTREVLWAGATPTVTAHLHFLYFGVLICALIVGTFIDIDLKIIPDGSTLPAMLVGVVGGFLLVDVHLTEVWYQEPYMGLFDELVPQNWTWLTRLKGRPEYIADWPHLHGLAVSLAGLIVGGAIVWSVRILGEWVLGREAMGFGDVILLAMIGSFMGWQATAMVFFMAPLFALLAVVLSWMFWRHREIPFGPYLSMAAIATLFGWKWIWPRTEQIFSLGIYLPVVSLVMLSSLVVLLLGMRLVQKLLGIEPPPEQEWIEEWTAGDQNAYLAGEVTDQDQGQWRREQWPGIESGRGSLHRRRWRGGPPY